MNKYHVTYFYLATGMEGIPNREDFGWVEQVSAAAAIQQVATIRFPNPKRYCEGFTDRDWFRGCLLAVDEQGNKTYGRMDPAA